MAAMPSQRRGGPTSPIEDTAHPTSTSTARRYAPRINLVLPRSASSPFQVAASWSRRRSTISYPTKMAMPAFATSLVTDTLAPLSRRPTDVYDGAVAPVDDRIDVRQAVV